MHTHKTLTSAGSKTEYLSSGDWLGESELFRLEKKQVQGDLTAAISVFKVFFLMRDFLPLQILIQQGGMFFN